MIPPLLSLESSTKEQSNLMPPTSLVKEETTYWIALSAIPGIGPQRMRKLIDLFGSAQAVWQTTDEQLQKAGCSDALREILMRERATIHPRELWETYQGDWTILTLRDERYPKALKEITDPPLLLMVQGSLGAFEKPMLAVVGTRRPSRYGLEAVEQLVPPLCRAGLTIVSGLAYGIDAAAHRETLKAKGTTIAVLGAGLNHVNPVEHRPLAREILESGGAIVSEYPPDTKPDTFRFPERNRIIAGLSQATLVVEAPERSGALITASCALDAGREVFAVPGEISHPRSAGTNALIHDGATLVRSAEDILNGLSIGVKKAEEQGQLAFTARSPEEAAILKSLREKPLPIDLPFPDSCLSLRWMALLRISVG
jgi:DNA processing protein